MAFFRRPRQISLFNPPEAAAGSEGADLLTGRFADDRPIERATQMTLGGSDRGAEDPGFRKRSDLRMAVLGSGSKGNCVLVESEGRRFLLDAGFSCRELERRLAVLSVDPTTIEAIVLTHEHNDHVRGVERFSRRNKTEVFATRGTQSGRALKKVETTTIRSGRPFEVAGVEIEAFPIVHDAREPVGLLVRTSDGGRLGLASDLGVRSRSHWGKLIDLDLLLVESNYDVEMLRGGPYPWLLKQRIASRYGHLANEQASRGVRDVLCDSLAAVVLYHLSETNNLPALAETTTGEMLAREGARTSLLVAEQDAPVGFLGVDGVLEAPASIESHDDESSDEEAVPQVAL